MTDAHWMQRCIDLARRAEGRTAPNPMVGVVLVKDGRVLGEGWHRVAGEPHAEPLALHGVTQDLAGATMYVNLEPCCHVGRTAPCTDAILAAGIGRVVVGMVDPNPLMQGKGIEQLQAAGLPVEVGVDETACRELNAGYIKATTEGLPQVWLKVAATLDGAIADVAGHSQWITSEAARERGHHLRDRMDAILVGSGTLLGDDPALTTRIDGGRDALRVVLDSDLRCPVGARLFSGSEAPLIYCAPDAPPRDLPADIVRVPRSAEGLDLAAVLSDLAGRGVHNLLVEGGGLVHRALLDGGYADRLLLFLAPKVLPGGRGFVGGAPVELGQGPTFKLLRSEPVGDDLLLDYRVAR
jgi:diaminohydroxyphosphoribosylaminopyrimidine deaminase/5-amino-6-(5-phosphoribosylamino)uracil reductase